jgi:hypothetical protein
MVSHIVFSVFVFDQDGHLDARMNFVKGVTQGIGFDAGKRMLKAPGQCLSKLRVCSDAYTAYQIYDLPHTR